MADAIPAGVLAGAHLDAPSTRSAGVRSCCTREGADATNNRRLMPPRTVTLPPAMRPGWLLARKAFERRAALLGAEGRASVGESKAGGEGRAGADDRASTVAPLAAAQNTDPRLQDSAPRRL